MPWASGVCAWGQERVRQQEAGVEPCPGLCISEPSQGRKVGKGDDPPGIQHPLTSLRRQAREEPLGSSHVAILRDSQAPPAAAATGLALCESLHRTQTGLIPGLQVCSDCVEL